MMRPPRPPLAARLDPADCDQEVCRHARTRDLAVSLHRDHLAQVLAEVLDLFTDRDTRGVTCLRTSWVTERRLAGWRAALTAAAPPPSRIRPTVPAVGRAAAPPPRPST